MRRTFFAIAAVAVSLGAPAALAQSFPADDELTSYGAWEPEDGIGAVVRTDSEGGWSSLLVQRISGTTLNAIEFSYTFGSYDGDTQRVFRPFFGRNSADRVRLVVDGREFAPKSAIIEAAEDGGIGIFIHFYDPADESSSDVWEKSCPVIEAMKAARTITVLFPDVGYGQGGFQMTGKGSSAALRDIC